MTGVSLRFEAGGHNCLTPGHCIGKAHRVFPRRGGSGGRPPQEKFENLQLQRCVFLHSEAKSNVCQLQKNHTFLRQVNDLIPIST